MNKSLRRSRRHPSRRQLSQVRRGKNPASTEGGPEHSRNEPDRFRPFFSAVKGVLNLGNRVYEHGKLLLGVGLGLAAVLAWYQARNGNSMQVTSNPRAIRIQESGLPPRTRFYSISAIPKGSACLAFFERTQSGLKLLHLARFHQWNYQELLQEINDRGATRQVGYCPVSVLAVAENLAAERLDITLIEGMPEDFEEMARLVGDALRGPEQVLFMSDDVEGLTGLEELATGSHLENSPFTLSGRRQVLEAVFAGISGFGLMNNKLRPFQERSPPFLPVGDPNLASVPESQK